MITIEELRKVHDEAEAKAWDEMPHYMSHTDDSFLSRIRDASILAVARYVAERQRAVEPTPLMVGNAVINATADLKSIYRAMSAVAPLVVQSE